MNEIDELQNTIGFYKDNPRMMALDLERSLPVTAASMIPAIRAAKMGSLGSAITVAATEGAVTGAEAGVSTREKVLKRGGSADEADDAAYEAFTYGAVAGVALSKFFRNRIVERCIEAYKGWS